MKTTITLDVNTTHGFPILCKGKNDVVILALKRENKSYRGIVLASYNPNYTVGDEGIFPITHYFKMKDSVTLCND